MASPSASGPVIQPATPPSTPRRQTNRDVRVAVRTLRDIGWTYAHIAEHLHITSRQVGTAIQAATPKKRTGRPPVLTQLQLDELEAFIRYSKRNRRLPYWRLLIELNLDVGLDCIRGSLRRLGFKVITPIIIIIITNSFYSVM